MCLLQRVNVYKKASNTYIRVLSTIAEIKTFGSEVNLPLMCLLLASFPLVCLIQLVSSSRL